MITRCAAAPLVGILFESGQIDQSEDLLSLVPSQNYAEAVDRAALMLLAALRDYTMPPFSLLQLDVLHGRADLIKKGNFIRPENVRAVFEDIRERATTILSAQLREANAQDDVIEEMGRVFHRMLVSAEAMFSGDVTGSTVRICS